MSRQQQSQQQQQYQYMYEEEEDEEDVAPPPAKKTRRQQQLQSLKIERRLEELRAQLLDLRYRRLNRAAQFGLTQVNRMRDLEHRLIRQAQEELAVARARQAAMMTR